MSWAEPGQPDLPRSDQTANQPLEEVWKSGTEGRPLGQFEAHRYDHHFDFQQGGSSSSAPSQVKRCSSANANSRNRSRGAQALRDLAASSGPPATPRRPEKQESQPFGEDDGLLTAGGSMMVPPIRWRQQMLESSAKLESSAPGLERALRGRKQNRASMLRAQQQACQSFFEQDGLPQSSTRSPKAGDVRTKTAAEAPLQTAACHFSESRRAVVRSIDPSPKATEASESNEAAASTLDWFWQSQNETGHTSTQIHPNTPAIPATAEILAAPVKSRISHVSTEAAPRTCSAQSTHRPSSSGQVKASSHGRRFQLSRSDRTSNAAAPASMHAEGRSSRTPRAPLAPRSASRSGAGLSRSAAVRRM
eukprot:TRINITY_DN111531_c0_g1_i1.p1 TRINITY_DN111531_c0_g1~~TRINITY_DN111531_c0_g1_i1.p1  ORF type:complete len:363 (-),score=41.26 TRINITY_DN111531_c0_g1_i1:135-1223(-)